MERLCANPMVRKTASFFEFSLCLSRACLGKMIVFIYYKWLKNAVFRRQFSCSMRTASAPRCAHASLRARGCIIAFVRTLLRIA
jgi:hypothetical protein